MTTEPRAHSSGGESIKMRLLRFVAKDARIEIWGGAVCQLIDGRDRRLEVPTEIVNVALRDGLLEKRQSRLAVRAEGRAFLKRALSQLGLDEESSFAGQHGTFIKLAGGTDSQPLRYNLSESPLAGLARLRGKDGKPFLEDPAVAAGERLRADFTRGQLQPRITANWEAGVARGPRGARNGAADLSDTVLAARTRVARAIKVIGPDLSGVVLDVCCFLKGLETVERERQWPARSGKLMLRTGLRSLARHYGLMQ